MKKYTFILLIILFSIPTFFKMVRPGIYSMQDFHYFRLFQYDKCVKDFQIPCRWSPDAGLGYGEPLFNFYGQLSYFVGELFHLVGFSLVDSLKLLFILSLVLSALSMYLLAKEMWKDKLPALISSILYIYAPYRAVDVWVRGALPESVSFIFYPLIIYFFEKYIKTNKKSNLLLFGLMVSFLILNHNLSFLLFIPFLVVWVAYRIISQNKWKSIGSLVFITLLSLGVVSFYIFPVAAETKYVTLETTIQGYFNFRGHFAGLRQLLFSNNWGYGGSVFGPDDFLNISIGFMQWIVPLVSLVFLIFRKSIKEYKQMFLLHKDFFVLLFISAVFVFLINNKSIFVWDGIPQMAYIQFPWRFLGVLVFTLSLASGVLFKTVPEKLKFIFAGVVILIAIVFNFSYFRPDIWYNYSDSDLTSGNLLTEQMSASIGDYWPKDAGPIISTLAPVETEEYKQIEKRSNKVIYEVKSDTSEEIKFPINNFPGWSKSVVDNKVIFTFSNTPVRTISNMVSLISIIAFVVIFSKIKLHERKNS